MALFFVVKPIPPDQIDRSSRGAWLPRHDRYQDGPLFESAGGYYTLRDRPEVVLSNNDGCCVARSAEAKALGIRRGQPFFEVRDRLAQHQGRALSSNDALYGDTSSRLMPVIGQFSPEQEVYASDESFLRFTPGEATGLTALGGRLRARVRQWTGLRWGWASGMALTGLGEAVASHTARAAARPLSLSHHRSGGQMPAFWRTPQTGQQQFTLQYKFLGQTVIQRYEQLFVRQQFLDPRCPLD